MCSCLLNILPLLYFFSVFGFCFWFLFLVRSCFIRSFTNSHHFGLIVCLISVIFIFLHSNLIAVEWFSFFGIAKMSCRIINHLKVITTYKAYKRKAHADYYRSFDKCSLHIPTNVNSNMGNKKNPKHTHTHTLRPNENPDKTTNGKFNFPPTYHFAIFHWLTIC